MVAGVGLALRRVRAMGVVPTGATGRPAAVDRAAVADVVVMMSLAGVEGLEADEGRDGDGDEGGEDRLLRDEGYAEVEEGRQGTDLQFGRHEQRHDRLHQLLPASTWNYVLDF